MLDLRLLTPLPFIWLLASFIGTYVIVSRWQLPKFRVVNTGVFYAGVAVASVTTTASLFFLDGLAVKIGLTAATLLIIAVGHSDETRPLPPAAQLGWQLMISLVLVLSGWAIPYVTNPFGAGVIELGALSIPLSAAWIILMMNAVNWLDGLDGLASGVGIIALLTLAGVSLLPATQDTTTLSLALIGAGSLLGFFLHNAPPAKVYLGTTGSWFVGAFLALAALIGGGKVATATLVLAIPILDAVFVIVARLLSKQQPWVGDKRHLAHRFAALGWSAWRILFVIIIVSAALGIVAVTAQTIQKFWVLTGVAGSLAAVTAVVSYGSHGKKERTHP